MISTFSIASIALVIGMIAIMLIVGFKMPKHNRIWIILDIFIIVGAFIAAVYISIIFGDFINSNEVFFNIYSVDMQKASTFILNLPFVIAITGGLMIIVTYVSFKKREPNVLEFN